MQTSSNAGSYILDDSLIDDEINRIREQMVDKAKKSDVKPYRGELNTSV